MQADVILSSSGIHTRGLNGGPCYSVCTVGLRLSGGVIGGALIQRR